MRHQHPALLPRELTGSLVKWLRRLLRPEPPAPIKRQSPLTKEQRRAIREMEEGTNGTAQDGRKRE